MDGALSLQQFLPFLLVFLRKFATTNHATFQNRAGTGDILQITFYYYNECNFEQSFHGILISGTNYTFVILEMIVFLTSIIK